MAAADALVSSLGKSLQGSVRLSVPTGLGHLLVSPLLGLQFELGTTALLLLPLTLALGTLALAFIGSVGAALTLGLRNGSMLLALLVLPLFVPVLVFGAMAVAQADSGRIEAELSVLAAFALLAVFFSPFATAASLRLACE